MRAGLSDSADARLLADVGGTHARFAWQPTAGAPLRDVQTYRCAEHPSLQQAIETYLRDSGNAGAAQGAIGIANPITGDRVQMTNHHWSFSIEALRETLDLRRLLVLNDFAALAMALPMLRPDEKQQLCGGQPVPGAAMALIGPGTGLGVSGLLPCGEGYRALEGEGGHATLCGVTELEVAVLAQLQRRFGHASAERAVSGLGMVWVYEALCALDGVPVPAGLDAPGISAAALAGSDARAAQTLDLLFAFLGSMAGNLALTLGARGGIYLGGGVLPRVIERLDASPFYDRFVGKGRFRGFLEAIPVYLIRAQESPALRGIAQALR
ncbi:glucokinase [Paucibacter sp. O1-1]|nr:glucokinase [Paucibacter sp. O1-1]MDA3825169.1 glucokinase [Paucibacter sp. O1-1]